MVNLQDEYLTQYIAGNAYQPIDYTDYYTLQYSVLTEMSDYIKHIDIAMTLIMFCVLFLWLWLIVRRKGGKL